MVCVCLIIEGLKVMAGVFTAIPEMSSICGGSESRETQFDKISQLMCIFHILYSGV